MDELYKSLKELHETEQIANNTNIQLKIQGKK